MRSTSPLRSARSRRTRGASNVLLVDIFIDDNTQWFRQIFDIVGTPLLIAVIVGMITLGRGAGMTRKQSPPRR